ncbi:MAG: hypothetical protein FJ358_01580 [Thaumarchaeota archaeon]|nr:hypothetical protein [Nitrososphaerota archaeon]
MSVTEEAALAEMTKRLDSLAVYKRGIITQLRELNQRGKELQVEFGKLTERLRTERDQLNELFPRLKEYKDKRIEIILKLKEGKEQVRKVGTTLKGYEKGGFESDKILTEKLNKIEWKLQTERLTREEEKELVQLVRELEAKLKRYKKVNDTRQEFRGIIGDVNELSDKVDEIDVAADAIREEIGKRKESVHQLLTQRQKILDEIKERGKDIGELRTQLDKAYAEFEDIRKKRNDLIISMKAKDTEIVMLKRKAFLEKAKDEAKSKLEAGMTLSFDELRLALGEDA